jgi:hypothetical protein
MLIENLCAPAILYLAFSLTQILIDIFRKTYNLALMKAVVTIVFTGVLNILCSRGLGVISWLLVFIPFITMTFVTAILLYVFGLSPITGKLDYSVYTPNSTQLQQQPLDIREQQKLARMNLDTWKSLQSMPSTTNMQKTSSTTLSSTPAPASPQTIQQQKPIMNQNILAMEQLYKLGSESSGNIPESEKVNVYSVISS